MKVVHDQASGFWTGKPWLVIGEEGEPALASFKTDAEAFDFVEQELMDTAVLSSDEREALLADLPDAEEDIDLGRE